MISVIIPTYNRLFSLKDTIKSLEAQSLNVGEFEVIVVDDGSDDGTYEWLSNYKGALNLRSVKHRTNKGTATTRNDGIRAAEGDIIVFLDDDMRAERDLLSVYLNAHQVEDGVFIGNVIYKKNARERALLQYLSTRGVHKGKKDFTCFITQNASVKKKDAIDAGLFDDSIPCFFQGEDIEFAYKLSLLNKRFVYIKEAVAFHSYTVNLQKVLLDAERFGEHILPLLLDKYPAFKKTFKLYLLDPVHLLKEPLSFSVQKLIVRFSLYRRIYNLIRRLTILFNGFFVPLIFFDYLIFYNRTKWMSQRQSL
ncbi:MAG: glycosyltransferase family 2 protein [candidate division WOR-3 bacterium]|nr:glycosyltransferase family 2 protein [candidate division WOR-3 bacterium]